MQVGEVIRTYRKRRNMTQEEMAKRLGVTAPAVNKWEKGNSLPDIMLLAPIARLLGITTDTLLSFEEELADEEINGIIREIDSRMKSEGYGEVFRWAKKQLEKYPNSEKLLWQTAVVLDERLLSEEIPDRKQYDKYIRDCYVRLLESKNEDIRNSGADSLFSYYTRKKDYEKAEKYLAYFSDQNPEKKRKQAFIYSKTNRRQEAYRTYEELLLSGYQRMNAVFSGIGMLAMEEENTEKARRMAEKRGELAELFEMGEYHKASCFLEPAVWEKDVDAAISVMEHLAASVEELGSFCRSPLYEHMNFKEIDVDFLAQIKKDLLNSFRDEETYGFLKEDVRWKELTK